MPGRYTRSHESKVLGDIDRERGFTSKQGTDSESAAQVKKVLGANRLKSKETEQQDAREAFENLFS